MPDKKISQLPLAVTPLAGNELLPIVQSGVTKKVQVSDIKPANATETTAGIAEIATQAEVNAGTDDTTIVTPVKLASFVNGVLGGVDLQSSYNNSSNGTIITDAIRGAVDIKGGTGNDNDKIMEFRNNADELIGHMDGHGRVTAIDGLSSFIIPTNVSSTNTNHWQKICIIDLAPTVKGVKHVQLSFIQTSVIDYIAKNISSILHIVVSRDDASGALVQCRIENHGNYKLDLADFEILYNSSTLTITIYKRVIWNWTGGSCSLINSRGNVPLKWDGSWVGTSLSGEVNDSWLEKSIVEVTVGNATETVAGIAEIATQAEVNAGTDDTTFVTPAKLAAYVTNNVTGLYNDRGNYDASVNAFSSSGGSGSGGAIKKGDTWRVSVAGTLPTNQYVEVGDWIRALTDSPGNTAGNWAITQGNIAFNVAARFNSAGIPIYYASLQAAINAASAGETVQLFANVTEDVVLKDGVNINGNNFELYGTGTTYTISMNSTVSCFISNLILNPNTLGFFASSTGFMSITNNSKIYFSATYCLPVETSLYNTLYVEAGSYINGINWYGTINNKGKISNVNINGTLFINGGSIVRNITGEVEIAQGYDGTNVTPVLYNVNILSNGSSLEGFEVYDSMFYGNTNAAVAVNTTSKFYNCTFVNDSNPLHAGGVNIFENCRFINKIGLTGVPCVLLNGNGANFNNCYFETAASTDKAIDAGVTHTIALSNSSFKTLTQALGSNVANIFTATADAQGNMFIG